MRTGRINKWFNERDYGFVQEANGGSHFLHIANVVSGTPTTGAYVRFQAQSSSKGSSAINAEVFATRQDLEAAVVAEAMANSTEVSRGK